jgi:hypothetical protein
MLFWVFIVPFLWLGFLVLMGWLLGNHRDALAAGALAMLASMGTGFMAAHHALNIGCECEDDADDAEGAP